VHEGSLVLDNLACVDVWDEDLLPEGESHGSLLKVLPHGVVNAPMWSEYDNIMEFDLVPPIAIVRMGIDKSSKQRRSPFGCSCLQIGFISLMTNLLFSCYLRVFPSKCGMLCFTRITIQCKLNSMLS
jgi:hypothetical protein